MASQATSLKIIAPVGGINRRTGYQNQPPFTTFDSLNFWPIDVATGRAVSGTRPALAAREAPTGTVFNFIERVNGVASGKPLESMVMAVDGDVYWWNGTTWTAATGTGADQMEVTAALYGRTFLQKTFIPQFGDKPWVFDYVTGTVEEMVETEGTVPDDLRFFEVWQGTLWGAGSLTTPNILYGSRVGDAFDWDFAVPITDEGGAFFTGGENEGRLRGPITAIMNFTSDTMIVSTTEGLTAMRGHPRAGGVFEDIGSSYVLGQGAWCKTDMNELYFLSRLGMMKMAAAVNAVPVPVSRDKIPDDLVGLEYDFANPTVEMEFCSRWNCIYITVRGSDPQAWMYDLSTGGFHRMSLAAYPYRMTEFFPFVNADQSGVVFASDDLYSFDRTGVESFAANLLMGPFAITPAQNLKSKIVRAQFTFVGDTPSADGLVSFHPGADAEDTIDRVEFTDPEFTVGLLDLYDNNNVCHPHVSGQSCTIEIDITGGRLAVEDVTINLTAAGVNRMTRIKNSKSVCRAYVTNTPALSPASDISDGIEIINMNAFPEEWWDLAATNGGNVRVTDTDNNFLPFDLIGFEKLEGSSRVDRGAIVLRRPLPTTPTAVRCWVCDSNVARFPLGSEFGQYNTYPPWILVANPGDYGPSRTRTPVTLDPISGGPYDEIELVNPFHPGNPYPDAAESNPECDETDGQTSVYGAAYITEEVYTTLFEEVGGLPENGMTMAVHGGISVVDPCEGIDAAASSYSTCHAYVFFGEGVSVQAHLAIFKIENGTLSVANMIEGEPFSGPVDVVFASNSISYTSQGGTVTGSFSYGGTGVFPSQLSITPGSLAPNMLGRELEMLQAACAFLGIPLPDVYGVYAMQASGLTLHASAYDALAYEFFRNMYRPADESDPAVANNTYWGSWGAIQSETALLG